jgi:glutamate synthase domain-containing protein 3
MERVMERETLDWDLTLRPVRELNQFLHDLPSQPPEGRGGMPRVRVHNPDGRHSIAVGLTIPVDVDVLGDGGYFLGGMNQQAHITVKGNVGWSVAENLMSGSVRVHGSASECAGASAHGGLLVIEGDASSRCGISLKGGDIVVGGDVGHMSAFMAQAGTLVVCGDAGPALGDSLYEAVIYVRGTLHGLGADAQEEPLGPADVARLATLLDRARFDHDPLSFKRIASAKKLYHWHVDHASAY